MTDAAIICVDGPSGAGKGTLSLRLARTLGWHLLDSGAMYRVVAHACWIHGIDWQDEAQVVKTAMQLQVSFEPDGDGVAVWLEGQEVTRHIRSERGSLGASAVAALPGVRVALLDRQRSLAVPPGLVADGRDMGTVVFPDAPLKIFLTASAEARARRRQTQLLQRGESVSLPRLLEAINERDRRDSDRSVSPLVAAEDAIVIDSSDLSADGVFHYALGCVAERGFELREPT